jgi:hypothetical protein
VVRGRVPDIKWQDSDFGGSLKTLIRDGRGFKVWGTVPSAVDDVEPVEFTAVVEASRDDHTFGFFKRSSKAQLLAAA